MEPARPAITFDADGRVRVLDEDKFKATEELEKEARAFIGSECCFFYIVDKKLAHDRLCVPNVATSAFAFLMLQGSNSSLQACTASSTDSQSKQCILKVQS